MKSLIFLLLVSSSWASAQELSLKDYLSQVEGRNQSYQGSRKSSAGASLRQDDGNLLFAPNFFADMQAMKDKKPTDAPIFQGTETSSVSYEAGISQVTSFGLTGKIAYSLNRYDIKNAPLLPVPQSNQASPSIELSQSLLRNGFGSETRAQRDLERSGNRANSFSNAFQARQEMVNAELAYWRLAIARKIVEVEKDSLTRAEKMLAWAERRAKLQLGDRSDELQAQASLELARLQLKAAQDEEASAAFSFNSSRSVTGAAVLESLVLAPAEELIALQAPQREDLRLDVKAANEQRNAVAANSRLNQEKVKPGLELFASVAWNGRDPDQSTAMQQSLSGQHPTQAAGIKFSTPLLFGLMHDTSSGADLEREGADLNFQKKFLDQEQSWQDLNTKLHDAQKRLELTKKLETVQKEKMENEQRRLLRGRTTTYQTLLFEQDYDNAALQRVNTQAEVLRAYAQMKLFGGEK